MLEHENYLKKSIIPPVELGGTWGYGPFNNSPIERARMTVEVKKVPITSLMNDNTDDSKK
jgi:hypothetical protein